jgi:hypothetical protein
LSGRYIAIGWDKLGNLLHTNKKAIIDDLGKHYPGKHDPLPKSQTNNAASLWSFSREIQVGDVVIANSGLDQVRGIGVVTSSYIPPSHPGNPRKGEPLGYLQVRRVEWLVSFKPPRQLPTGCTQFAQKTVHRARIRIDDSGTVLGESQYTGRLTGPLSHSGKTVNDLRDAAKKAIAANRIASRYGRAISTNRNLILHGPPGTGKTHEALQLAAHILDLSPAAGDRHVSDPDRATFLSCRLGKGGSPNHGRWEIVQFHSAYHYEDFVRGIRVSTPTPGAPPSYTTENGIFGEMCEAAAKDPDHDYVLVIDEINRAPLAGVFGELIYGLEYREEEVETPYAIGGSSSIKVPKNLYVIGTMNTADRSIGHIDYAIRRRFAFIPLLPERENIKQYDTCDPRRNAALKLYDSVARLFGPRNQGGYLSPEFHRDDVQPGHTYFLAESCDQLYSKFVYQVLPLLREYLKDGVLDPKASMTIGKNNYLDSTSSHQVALDRLPEDVPCDDCEEDDQGGDAQGEG